MRPCVAVIVVLVCSLAFADDVGPTADFRASPMSGEIPLTVQFTDRSDPGTELITSWASAFQTIQEGIDAAEGDGGGEVWVAESCA